MIRLIFFLLTVAVAVEAATNFEEQTQDFVLESKQINIPGYPYAFNPAIIRWEGKLLLSFRVVPNRKSNFDSLLGLIWLDEELNPVGEPHILDTRGSNPSILSRAEDARLAEVDGHLYMIYSNNIDKKITRGGFRVFVSEIKHDGHNFSLHNTEKLSQFEGESQDIREKNWVAFDYQNKLHLAYSLNPHRILRPLLDQTETCETICTTSSHMQWEFGEPRGGTPGILIGDQYLSFFHSSKRMTTEHSEGQEMLHYFMGAYTFSAKPPFEITQISPQPLLGKGFYQGPLYKNYWRPVRVVFPGGFVADEHFIWIAYGKQDHECWIVKLDKQQLFDSLIPVTASAE